MSRRFLLIGLFVVFPFHQGSVMQVATANLFCIVYLMARATADQTHTAVRSALRYVV